MKNKNNSGYSSENSNGNNEVNTHKRLNRNEQENIMSYNIGEDKTYVSCSIPSMWKEYEKKNWTLTKVINYIDGVTSVKFYEADGDMTSIRNTVRKERQYTEEQRQRMSENAKRMQQAKKDKKNVEKNV